MPVANTQPVYPPPSGSPIQSVWGTAVSEHVIQRFVNTADRDAKWTSPPDGAVCEAPVGVFFNRQAGAWVEMSTQTRARTWDVSPSTPRFRISTTGVVVTTNPGGFFTLTYQEGAFATKPGVVAIIDSSAQAWFLTLIMAQSTPSYFAGQIWDANGNPLINAGVLVHYIAVGT
jgi:hypothetical protein